MTNAYSIDTPVSNQDKKRSTKRLTTATFIRRSKDAHGNRFSYEKTIYKNYRTKLIITCKGHGDVLISPSTHLDSDGCPDCVFENNPKRWSTKRFVREATEKFGDLYDYSLVVYKNKNTMLDIKCPIHGITKQRASVHLGSKVGCPHCNGNGKLDNNRFADKANEVHDFEYDYSLVDYQGANSLVTIGCISHGFFEQLAGRHLSGQKCLKCRQEKQVTDRESLRVKAEQDFLARAEVTHKGFYCYKSVEYKNSGDKVVIKCPSHGYFSQSPNSHLNQRGCNACAIEYKVEARRKKEASVFVSKAVAKHGSRYNYDAVEYIRSKDRVEIGCPQHNTFLQTVADHLAGCGCPDCGRETGSGWSRGDFLEYAKFKSKGQAKLYIIKCFNDLEVFYKVGITARSVAERFKDIQAMPYNHIVIMEISGGADYIYDLENSAHRLLAKFSYKPLKDFHGKTECFSLITDEAITLIDSYDTVRYSDAKQIEEVQL